MISKSEPKIYRFCELLVRVKSCPPDAYTLLGYPWALLKEVYSDAIMETLVYGESALLARLPKQDFKGSYIPIPIHTEKK